MNQMSTTYRLGVDIGSTTVKVAVLDQENRILFSDYERHYANIQETLAKLLKKAVSQTGDILVIPVITGSGGLTLSSHLHIPFVQEVVAVASSLQDYAPQTDVAIELGGEDAKIIYFTGGIDQRMNGICAGGTGSFIDQMASLLQTDASGLNEYAKNYQAIYPIAAFYFPGSGKPDHQRPGLWQAYPGKRGIFRRSPPLPSGAEKGICPYPSPDAGADHCPGALPPVCCGGRRYEP